MLSRKMIDITGMRFGRRVVVAYAGTARRGQQNVSVWDCVCDCGKSQTVRIGSLRTAASCGCRQREAAAAYHTKHGHCSRSSGETRTHRIWKGMITRCTNPKSKHWLKYGARGIGVCERWRKFENFLADMGQVPPGLTLEREDNAGNYEPGNCRWATPLEQAQNTRRNNKITINGVTKILAEWARESGVHRRTIMSRLALGWDAHSAVFARGVRGDNQFVCRDKEPA